MNINLNMAEIVQNSGLSLKCFLKGPKLFYEKNKIIMV